MECADVGFVVDVSSSVMGYFEQEKEFVKQLAKNMGVSASGVHVSVVQFSNNASLEIRFRDDITHFTSEVDALTLKFGTTRIDEGLDVAFTKMFQPYNGMRPYEQCSKVVILLTDGHNDFPLAKLDVAKRFHDAGIRVVAIGIGNNVRTDELDSLVELKSDRYLAKDFDELKSDSFVNSVINCQP